MVVRLLQRNSRSFFYWDYQFIHDVIFALGRVLAHVEVEDRAGLGARGVFHFARPHFFADELREFLGLISPYLGQPGDLGRSKSRLDLCGCERRSHQSVLQLHQ